MKNDNTQPQIDPIRLPNLGLDLFLWPLINFIQILQIANINFNSKTVIIFLSIFLCWLLKYIYSPNLQMDTFTNI